MPRRTSGCRDYQKSGGRYGSRCAATTSAATSSVCFISSLRRSETHADVTVGAKVGRSALVDRIVLLDFLDRVAESDDPEVTLQARRNVPSPTPRRKLRHLIQLDCDVATLETMPANITARLASWSSPLIRWRAGKLSPRARPGSGTST